MARKRLLSPCCGEDIQTEEPGFQPIVKSLVDAQAAFAAGQPLFCSGCGKDVAAVTLMESAASREP